MEQFSYAFTTTMIHSIWQTALLLLLYAMITTGNPKSSPLSKRNLLFTVLGLQLISTTFTFYIIYSLPLDGLLQDFIISISSSLQYSWMQTNAQIFFWLYCCVVIFRLLSLGVKWAEFKTQYPDNHIKPAVDIRLFTLSKALHFGINKKVTLWYSNAITTPMTFGFWKPVILLPIALVNQLSIQQTEALILHELTHIRHNDYLLNWFLVVAETLFFFNPFIHIIAQKIKTEREKNCDVQVLQFNYPDILYAETLLKTAQYHQKKLSMQLAAVKSKKQLLHRIHFFSKNNSVEFKKNQPILSGFGLIAVLLIHLSFVWVFIQKGKNDIFVPASSSVYKLKSNSNETGKVILTEPVNYQPLLVANMEPVQAKTKRLNKLQRPDRLINSNNPEEILMTEDEVINYAIPASIEQTLIEGKEIIINEENTEGKKITAAYKALLINGIWTLQPLWMISETKTPNDSLSVTKKDTVIRIIPTIQ